MTLLAVFLKKVDLDNSFWNRQQSTDRFHTNAFFPKQYEELFSAKDLTTWSSNRRSFLHPGACAALSALPSPPSAFSRVPAGAVPGSAPKRGCCQTPLQIQCCLYRPQCSDVSSRALPGPRMLCTSLELSAYLRHAALFQGLQQSPFYLEG